MQQDGLSLYRRFLEGDERGLEELISLYQHSLLRFIYGYTRDLALAEDVMQETFIALYFHRNFQPRDDATFKTYLYKIARNKSLNAIKRRKRKKEVSLQSLISPLDDERKLHSFLSTSPHAVLEEKERSQQIQSALNQLPVEYREVLALRYFEGLSPQEIAKVTKRKIKRVYNLLARGKTALKTIMEKDGIRYENG